MSIFFNFKVNQNNLQNSVFCPALMNTVFENGMFWKLIFFHSEIAQYKEAVLTKSDKARMKEEREREKKSSWKDTCDMCKTNTVECLYFFWHSFSQFWEPLKKIQHES